MQESLHLSVALCDLIQELQKHRCFNSIGRSANSQLCDRKKPREHKQCAWGSGFTALALFHFSAGYVCRRRWWMGFARYSTSFLSFLCCGNASSRWNCWIVLDFSMLKLTERFWARLLCGQPFITDRYNNSSGIWVVVPGRI